jgi:hypothetical protein
LKDSNRLGLATHSKSQPENLVKVGKEFIQYPHTGKEQGTKHPYPVFDELNKSFKVL